MNETYLPILTVAGSDSGGCAGIQADIKSISANGGYAATVITATTAQNTCGVFDIHSIPLNHLKAQLEAVLNDIDFSAVKVGMLHSVDVINLVKHYLELFKVNRLVIDPVMVAASGDKLIDEEAIKALEEFLPLADLITPNLTEATILLGEDINPENLAFNIKKLADKYQVSVLIKAVNLNKNESKVDDVFYDFKNNELQIITHEKIDTNNTHGTGCTLSSSIATHLGKGLGLQEAVKLGCEYTHSAIKFGKNKHLGQGKGPVNHFYLFSNG